MKMFRFSLFLAISYIRTAGPAGAQPLSPVAGNNFPSGAGPSAIIQLDVALQRDNDGALAIANHDGNSVSVMFPYGYTSLQHRAGSPFPVGAGPVALTTADFNSDRLADIAVANSDGTVTVLLAYLDSKNNVLYRQAAGSPIATSLFQSSIACGDFNGDGMPDLAVTNQAANTVTILLGIGLGRFTPAPGSPFPAGTDPRYVLVADLNRDGIQDLAIANGSAGKVTILLGNGRGGFSPSSGSPFAVGTLPQFLVLESLNDDLNPDLLVINHGSNDMTLLLGDGAGNFAAAPGSPVAVGIAPASAMNVGSYLAVVNQGSNSVSFLLRDGRSGFSMANSYATGQSPVSAALWLGRDLFIANNGSGDVTWLANGSLPIGPFEGVGFSPGTPCCVLAPGQTGGSVTFLVTNYGNNPIIGRSLTLLNSRYGLTLVSLSAPGWSCAGNTCAQTATLPVGGKVAFTATFNVPADVAGSVFLDISGPMGVAGGVAVNILPSSGAYVSSSPVTAPLILDGLPATPPFTLPAISGRHRLNAPYSFVLSGALYVFDALRNVGVFDSNRNASINPSSPGATTAYYNVADINATRFQLTAASVPSAAGPVSPATGTLYPPETVVPVSVASSLSTFQFSNWTGGVANPSVTSTSVTMDGPKTLSANFIPISSFFVRQLYRDLLTREPDPAGLSYWQGLIDNGRLPREIVTSSIFTSPEFTQSGLYVIKLYVGVLGRDPDFGGWLNWFTGLRNGATPASVLNLFLASAEFQNTYGSLSNSDFVTLVYRNVLGRAPDPGGFANWLGQLNGGQLSRGDVMGAFVNGPEFDNIVRSRAYANLLYMGFLRRTPDPAGLTYWTGILAAANPLSGAIYGFINGPEYLNRLASLTP